MQQTPMHYNFNPDLLSIIPSKAQFLIEIGCSSGSLAREFKKKNPKSNYLGIDINESYLEIAKKYCDEVYSIDLDTEYNEFFWQQQNIRDCWIFGDVLEHLKDPWKLLKKIRSLIPLNGTIAACIPNAQHWSQQIKLNIGDFRYQENGLMDKTHLRWFTRQTIIEMFEEANFQITKGIPRIFNEPDREKYLNHIGAMAEASGFDPRIAINDCLPLQYVVLASPKSN